jgi:preprotein translocase subunit SecD
LLDAEASGQHYRTPRLHLNLVDSQPTFNENNQPAVTFRFNHQVRVCGLYQRQYRIAFRHRSSTTARPPFQSLRWIGIITGQFTLEESTNLAALPRPSVAN